MTGQRVGYTRVSTLGQNLGRQLDGVQVDRVFTDSASGRDTSRPQRALAARGVRVEFVKEQLTFTGDDTAMATLLLSVMGAFAEFERSLIRERQREGIALARQRGVYRGRPPALTAVQVAQVQARVAADVPKATVARDLGISRETLYKYLRTSATTGIKGAVELDGTQHADTTAL